MLVTVPVVVCCCGGPISPFQAPHPPRPRRGGHVGVHGRVVSGCRIVPGASRVRPRSGGGDAERLDRQLML